jgi:hypothetical protein
MGQLKNYQIYYSKKVTLFIVETEKGEDVNWAGVLF